MKKIFLFAFILTISTSLYSAEPCLNERDLLTEKRIDLETKSLKGWVRLLKNRSKQNSYGVYLNKEETQALIRCLLDEIENRKKQGKMS